MNITDRTRARVSAAAAAIAVIAAPATGIAAAPATAHGPAAQATKCRNVKIGGHRKCIAAGQACSRRYQKTYLRYGLSCARVNGRYRLVSNHLTF